MIYVYCVLVFCFFFFFKQKTAYEIGVRLVGSEMCIRDRSRPSGPTRAARRRPNSPSSRTFSSATSGHLSNLSRRWRYPHYQTVLRRARITACEYRRQEQEPEAQHDGRGGTGHRRCSQRTALHTAWPSCGTPDRKPGVRNHEPATVHDDIGACMGTARSF